MRPDIYPTDHHQERLQREEDEREEVEVICAPCVHDDHRHCDRPFTCDCPQRDAHWWACSGCRENPVRHPSHLCSECQDPDPIEEPS